MSLFIKRIPTLFLQSIVVLIGIGTIAGMLWEPHLEGRNAHATFFEIYFNDPFLAYVYIVSTPFFVALYQAFIMLGHIQRNSLFSPDAVHAIRIIQYCAIALFCLVVLAEIFIVATLYSKDDIAGGVAMGLFAMFGCTVITAAATVLEGVVRSAVEMKQHLPA